MATVTAHNDKREVAADALARAAALVPRLAERADACEAARNVPAETIADYKAAGLNRLMHPARYGGLELGWDTIAEAGMTYAHGCASQGWVLTIYNDHARMIATYDPRLQDEIWGDDPDTLTAAAFAPVGKVVTADGGWRLSGKWGFSSGIDYADWLICGAMLPHANGAMEPNFFLVPKSEATVIDDWHFMGLAGTGSKSFTLEDAFVPSYRVQSLSSIDHAAGPGAKINSAPVYQLPLRSASFALACVPLGAAEAMVEAYIAHNAKRVQRGGKAAENVGLQLRIAESAAEVKAARMMLLTGAREMMEVVERGEHLTTAQLVNIKRDVSYTVVLAARAVDRLISTVGAHGLYLTSGIQRAFRDVHAGAAHTGLDWELGATDFGRLALGLEPLQTAL